MEVGFTVASIGGACPSQASGRLGDGRPFYFWARHGEWELEVGPPDGDMDGDWIGEQRWVVAQGTDSTDGYMVEEDVRSILQRNLA